MIGTAFTVPLFDWCQDIRAETCSVSRPPIAAAFPETKPRSDNASCILARGLEE